MSAAVNHTPRRRIVGRQARDAVPDEDFAFAIRVIEIDDGGEERDCLGEILYRQPASEPQLIYHTLASYLEYADLEWLDEDGEMTLKNCLSLFAWVRFAEETIGFADMCRDPRFSALAGQVDQDLYGVGQYLELFPWPEDSGPVLDYREAIEDWTEAGHPHPMA